MIGGSTEEAQQAIGIEVGHALVRFLSTGSTIGCVNFPESDLRALGSDPLKFRITNVHQNVPGVLRQVSKALSIYNIEKQVSITKGTIGYLMADIKVDNPENIKDIKELLCGMKENIRTEILSTKK